MSSSPLIVPPPVLGPTGRPAANTLASRVVDGGSTDWYRDWQSEQHAISFDVRAGLGLRDLIRNYESFNDVRLLNERVDRQRPRALLEIGCATGEFYRYLRARHPLIRYYGLDISQPAVARAKVKYPEASIFVTDPTAKVSQSVRTLEIPLQPEVIYAKDVVHHQTQPFEFLSELVRVASETVIIRTRTRDVGQTDLDPERSCQYHYDGWMPYLVLNLEELIECIRTEASDSEVVVYRHHMILGGRFNRFVPKELYYRETGTAETAVGIFKQTQQPGRVTVMDRVDQNPTYTWGYRLKHATRQALHAFNSCTVAAN